jgi:pimeloyl-ACP methyl ester carboxylesterase
MRASYFGPSERPLFGVYHPPLGAPPRDAGVLLCYPAPQEYMRTHWAFRKLAGLLCRRGFHVFRFDYFATGDSAGESAEARLDAWRDDVALAARELRDIASVSKIAAVGFRLGASIAATAERVRFTDLVLWEPVVNGRVYQSELGGIQARLRARNPHVDDRVPLTGELLGFPMGIDLEGDLAAVNLLRSPLPLADRIFVMVADVTAIHAELAQNLRRRAANALLCHVPEVGGGTGGEDLGAALLSNTMLEAIAEKLS